MHNWQNKVHASSITVVVLRLSPNGRCGGVGGVVVRYVRYQEGTTTSMEWHNWMDHGGVNGRKGAG
jgi:hypothetical protein